MELWYVIRVDNEPSSAAQLKVNSTAGSGAGLMNTRRLQYFQRITGQVYSVIYDYCKNLAQASEAATAGTEFRLLGKG